MNMGDSFVKHLETCEISTLKALHNWYQACSSAQLPQAEKHRDYRRLRSTAATFCFLQLLQMCIYDMFYIMQTRVYEYMHVYMFV